MYTEKEKSYFMQFEVACYTKSKFILKRICIANQIPV